MMGRLAYLRVTKVALYSFTVELLAAFVVFSGTITHKEKNHSIQMLQAKVLRHKIIQLAAKTFTFRRHFRIQLA
jgi:hypothetical protein